MHRRSIINHSRPDKLKRGMHVEIASNVINDLQFFDQQIRWAKADLVQQVSRNRLNRARTYRGYLNQCLPHELVADIQRAVIKSINAISLIIDNKITIPDNDFVAHRGPKFSPLEGPAKPGFSGLLPYMYQPLPD